MKLYKRFRQRGFSLTEVMISVAILGILASIGVPSYIQHVHHSQQAEAKSNLASLAGAMRSFWAEYASYTDRLDAVGFNPEGSQKYQYGFTNGDFFPATLPVPVKAQGTAGCTNTGPSSPCPAGYGHWINEPAATAATLNFTSISGGGFVAAASGRINGTTDDIWTIDSQDQLLNPQPGL